MTSDEDARGSASMTNTGLVIVVLTLAGAAGVLVWKSNENNRARPAHTPLDIATLEEMNAVRGQHNGDPGHARGAASETHSVGTDAPTGRGGAAHENNALASMGWRDGDDPEDLHHRWVVAGSGNAMHRVSGRD